MFTAIIIEDERNAREFLEKLIIRHLSNKVIVLNKVDSIAKGVEAINKHKPDIVFLDIQLNNENGFDLFKHFKVIDFDVIFTTAFKDYSIKAIRYSALDYILKPINIIDLNAAIRRLENKKDVFNQEKINTLLENLNTSSDKYNKIAFPTEKGYELEKVSNIVYCQAQSNYAKIKTFDGREILLSKTLKYVEELLPKENFVRTHKSYLVNLNYVTSYLKTDNILVLVNNEQIPVSARKNTTLVNAILKKN